MLCYVLRNRCKEHVVQHLEDVQIECETRPEWARDWVRDDACASTHTRQAEEGTQERGGRGRSRTSNGAKRKTNLPGNELGLSDMTVRRDATVAHGGDLRLPTNES